MQPQETVFISWSGKRSKAVASILKGYLEACFQRLTVFFSDDIPAGEKFLTEIGQTLEDAAAAIVVVTPENAQAPWLNYEAGAIGHARTGGGKNRKVICLLVGYESEGDYEGPLSQYQNVLLDEGGLQKLTESVAQEISVDPTNFSSLFRAAWSERVDDFDRASQRHAASAPLQRSDRDYLDEILQLTRLLVREARGPESPQKEPVTGKVLQKSDDFVTLQTPDGRVVRLPINDESSFVLLEDAPDEATSSERTARSSLSKNRRLKEHKNLFDR